MRFRAQIPVQNFNCELSMLKLPRIIPKDRVGCGQPRISREEREQDNACCYDDRRGKLS